VSSREYVRRIRFCPRTSHAAECEPDCAAAVRPHRRSTWSREDVISTLRESMTRAFRHIVETSERERVTLRDAAYMIGIGSVAEASRLKGVGVT
jgi:hypothetical protein